MLDSMRRSANSWLFILLFAAITFVFAINFGPWAGNVGGGENYAVDVNGRVVTLAEFQSAYSNQFRILQNYRPGFTAEQAEAEGLKKMVVDQLVAKELLAQLAQKHGLTISDEELATFIKTQFFGKDKPFDREAYKRAIYSAYQVTEAQFESQLRRELLADRAADLVGTGGFVSDAEVKASFVSRHNRVSLDVLRINPKTLVQGIKVAEAQAAEWGKTHEAELKKYYDSHLPEFKSSKQVRARHILVKVTQQAADADKVKAREQIKAIQARLAKGEDFAKVATETSEDSSAKAGGDLGFFGEGAMVKPFEEAAFKLSAGQVSEVVESPFGLHIIKVEETKPPTSKELAEVKTLIAQRLLEEEQTTQAAQKAAAATLESAKTKGDLAALAKASGHQFVNTGLFRQDMPYVPQIGMSSEILAAAFALTPEKPVADKVFAANGELLIIKLKEREQADMAQFEKEKSGIRATLMMSRKRDIMKDYVEYLKKDAKISYNAQIVEPAKS